MTQTRAQSRDSKPKRTVTTLGAKLDKRLGTYIAAMAGATLLSVSLPAEAEIVYTPCNTPMAEGYAGGLFTPLDLNNDGVVDFSFYNFSYSTHGNGNRNLSIIPAQNGNEVIGFPIPRRAAASALPPGTLVGSSKNFHSYPKGLVLAATGRGTQGGSATGAWLKVETAFLGLKFLINGQVHYGWALVKFTGPGDFLWGSIYGYAYESIPGQPIRTGQTKGTSERKQADADLPTGDRPTNQSLGLLATGARGLRFWRPAVSPASTSSE
jgi:hypothetical protein